MQVSFINLQIAVTRNERMKEYWERLEIWLSTYLPEVLANLKPGCTDSELESLEQQLGVALPNDFKSFYLIHNGQELFPNNRITSGLFFGLEFLSVDGIYNQWDIWRELIATEEDIAELGLECTSAQPGKVKELYANNNWIPFAHDGSGNHLGLDLDPDSKGVVGQIINFGRDESKKYVLANSFTGFIDWLLLQYESGNFVIHSESVGNRYVNVFKTKIPEKSHFLDAVPSLFADDVLS
jgi:cell wall assembly regulator SMI1